MIEEVEVDVIYISRTGREFIVCDIGRHTQDCSITIIHYKNLKPTDDAPEMTSWFITESLFLKLFDYSNTQHKGTM